MAVCELKNLLGDINELPVETIVEIVTVFCRLQTLYCRELQVKREQQGSRFVDGVVCVVVLSLPAGDKLSTER
jgi:hypothetical protein